MTLHVKLPESLAAQARELAEREHTTLDALIASSLVATLDHSTTRHIGLQFPSALLGSIGREWTPSSRA